MRRSRSAIDEAYALFPRLAERRRNLGSQLSGGEQQMLATARTILGRPSILMLDEPLEGLAPVICDMLMAAFTQLAASGAHRQCRRRPGLCAVATPPAGAVRGHRLPEHDLLCRRRYAAGDGAGIVPGDRSAIHCADGRVLP